MTKNQSIFANFVLKGFGEDKLFQIILLNDEYTNFSSSGKIDLQRQPALENNY